MKPRNIIYVVSAAIFLLSVTIALVFPAESILREVSAISALGALFSALFQLFRDQSSFERQQFFQRQQESFSLGASSHMANVAFDKHVEFCEKYMAEVHSTVATLFQHGPTKKALEHVWRLVDLRREYAAWLPRDIVMQLEPFENAVNQIGALSHLETDLREWESDDAERKKAVQEMFKIFKEVLQIEGTLPVNEQPKSAVEAVKERLRGILGIEELTQLRRKLVERALASVE